MKTDNVEIFEDSSIVTLYDDDNNPVDFYEIACVELDEKFYGILQPVEPMEGLEDDEAVIFEIKRGEGDEEDLFVPLGDESVLDAVFNEYLKATADGCDCEDCEDCDGDECTEEGCSCHHHHHS